MKTIESLTEARDELQAIKQYLVNLQTLARQSNTNTPTPQAILQRVKDNLTRRINHIENTIELWG
jgi:hypothetical protein